jgi:hypothetical protein
LPEIFRLGVPLGDWQQSFLEEWAIFNQDVTQQGYGHGLSWLAQKVLTGVEQGESNGKVEFDAG